MTTPFGEYLRDLVETNDFSKHSLLVRFSDLDNAEIDVFTEWWPSISTEMRRTLINKLVNLAEENFELDFSGVFRYSLNDNDAEVRNTAVSGIWESDDHNLIGPLIAMLQNDPSELVRAAAAIALGKFGSLAANGKLLPRDGERIKRALISVLRNPDHDTELRGRSLESAAYFNTPEITDMIQQAYKSSDPLLCSSALYAMGRTGDSTWVPIIIREMDNRNPAMRYEAASASAEIMDEDAVPYLIPLIQDEDHQVQISAIRALGFIGGSLAKKAVLECINENNNALHEAAEQALYQMDMENDLMGFNY